MATRVAVTASVGGYGRRRISTEADVAESENQDVSPTHPNKSLMLLSSITELQYFGIMTAVSVYVNLFCQLPRKTSGVVEFHMLRYRISIISVFRGEIRVFCAKSCLQNSCDSCFYSTARTRNVGFVSMKV